jgi:hypothetical protein
MVVGLEAAPRMTWAIYRDVERPLREDTKIAIANIDAWRELRDPMYFIALSLVMLTLIEPSGFESKTMDRQKVGSWPLRHNEQLSSRSQTAPSLPRLEALWRNKPKIGLESVLSSKLKFH